MSGRPWIQPPLRAAVDDLTDGQVVALVLYGEARSQTVEGIVAVACVIRNRVTAGGWFGKGYRGVCLKPWQFSCLNPVGGDENYRIVLKRAQAWAAGQSEDDPIAVSCLAVARGVMHGQHLDPTYGARHYHARGVEPAWAQGHTATVIGSHLFFSTVT